MMRAATEETKVTQEIKLNFDNISETDKALFLAGLSPDRTKLSFSAFESGSCPQIPAINTFLLNNPHVTGFELCGHNISNSEFLTLTQSPSLMSLDLPCCRRITDAGMQALHNNTTLKSLRLLNCVQITGGGLDHLATMQITSLEFDVGSTANVIDLQVFANMPRLESLTLGCSGIQVALLPTLRSLTLKGAALTDADLAVLQNNPNLNLAFNACTGITDAAKAALKEADEKARLEDQAVKASNDGLLLFLMYAKKEARKTPAQLAADEAAAPGGFQLGKALAGNYLYGEALLRVIAEERGVPPRPRPRGINFKDTFH